MKFWQQSLLIAILGFAVAFVLPQTQDIIAVFEAISRVIVSVGRFIVFPLVFVGVMLGVYRLATTRHAGAFFLRTIYAILAVYIAVAIIGTVIGLAFVPERIPPILQEAQAPVQPDIATILSQLFPHNAFMIFSYSGDFLLPLVVFSMCFGVVCYLTEQRAEATIIPFFETLWTGLWRFVNALTTGLIVGMSVLALLTVLMIRDIDELRIYVPLLVVVLVAVGIVVFVLYPLAIVLLKRGSFRDWFETVTPVTLLALCSGDIFFCIPFIQRQLHTRFNTSETSTSTASVVSLLFCRAGTVMLSCICFLVVLRSYSTLEISAGQILGIIGLSLLFSLRLFSVSSEGVLLLLAGLSAVFVSEAGGVYLILIPIMGLLHRLAAIVDSATAVLIAVFVDGQESKELRAQSYEKKLTELLEDN